jgi:hypothetical protein
MTKATPKLLLPSMKGWEVFAGTVPELRHEGKRAYFPHITVPYNNTYAKMPAAKLTINAGGWPMKNHDAHALLIASAAGLIESLARIWWEATRHSQTDIADQAADAIMRARGFKDREEVVQAIYAAYAKGQLK